MSITKIEQFSVTPLMRIAYVHLKEPSAKFQRYEFVGLIPKNDKRWDDFRKALDDIIAAKHPAGIPDGFRVPWTDGDDEKADFMDGYWVVRFANRKEQPKLFIGSDAVGADNFYPGCWCRCQYYAFVYDNSGCGLSLIPNALRKIKDDTPLGSGGRVDPLEAFDAFADEDEDALNEGEDVF